MPATPWSPELRRSQAVRELLRMIRAVIRDGQVTDLEAEFIGFWLDEHAQLLELPPLDRMVPALTRLMHGGPGLTTASRDELLALLRNGLADYDGGGSLP